MVDFTCDLCWKDLTAACDARYVVRVETYPGFDPNELTEADLDDDPMQAVADLVQHDLDAHPHDLDQASAKTFRFDLCTSCHRRFLKDPLGKDALRVFDFSEN